MKKRYPEPFRRERSPYYYFTLDTPEGRRNLSTKETTKERARAAIRAHVDVLETTTSQLAFAEYAAPYFVWPKDQDRPTCPHARRLLDEGKSIGRTHCHQCRRLLERFALKDHRFALSPIKQIRRRDILELRERLRNQGVAINTVNKTICAVKIVLAEACFRGDIESDPGAGVGDVKYQQVERGVLLPSEAAGILSFLSERTARLVAASSGAVPVRPGAKRARASEVAQQAVRDEALVALLLCTGIRSGELRALRWGSIEFETGRARIDEACKGEDGIGRPKWGKVREIVIPRLALDRLVAWRDAMPVEAKDEYFIFGFLDKRPLGYEGAHNVFKTIIEEARNAEILPANDQRWLSPHAARHSLNTNLLASGLSPLIVQTYLGWSSAESRVLTRVQATYTHLRLLRIEEVAEMVDRIYTDKLGELRIIEKNA